MLVIVAATPATAEEAEAALREQGATVTERCQPAAERTLVWGGPFGDGEAVRVVGRLRAAGWPASDRPEGGGHLTAWRAHTAPVVIGDRLWVCFPWSEATRPSGGERGAGSEATRPSGGERGAGSEATRPSGGERGAGSEATRPSGGGAVVVEIDPVGAFGTGAHPSTLLLLHELVDRIVGGERVLDVGCGSGVLAIAAVRLGAASATAIDLVPAAVGATIANAARNGAGAAVHASATPVADLQGSYDVVLANIGCEALRLLGPDLARLVAPGGWLAVSGISPAQVSVVAAALPGLETVGTRSRDDWSALLARRV